MEWKVVDDPGQNTQKNGLGVSDGHLCGVVAVAVRGDKFHLHFMLIPYDYLCGFSHFVIEDMFLRYDTHPLEAEHQCAVGSC